MLHMLHVLHMSDVCRKKKIFSVKATGSNSFHRCGRSPSLEEGGLGVSPVKASGLAVDWI